MHVNSVESQCPPVGVVMPVLKSSSSLNRDSELQGPSPKALVSDCKCDINKQRSPPQVWLRCKGLPQSTHLYYALS
ncbi:hypothetical protein TNCV_2148851 [Trichonephila clavipes]|nr:hypothetical protein TNCV_2148851 [Trichonephila clavipes]